MSTYPGLVAWYGRERGEDLRREVDRLNRQRDAAQEDVAELTSVVSDLRELRRAGNSISIAAAFELPLVTEELNRASGKAKKAAQELKAAQERLDNWTVIHRGMA